MPGVRINTYARSRLTEALTVSGERAKMPAGDLQQFIAGWDSEDFLYCALRSASAIEIVKVDVGESNVFDGLKISRSEDGSDAGEWPAGTLIYQVLNAASIDNYFQKGQHREIAYFPDGILAPLYFGEKAYQSDFKLWWMAKGLTTSDWVLVAGTMPEQIDTPAISLGAGDGSWVEKTSDTYWSAGFGTWDGSEWDAAFFLVLYQVVLSPTGGWEADYRPAHMKVTFTGPSTLSVALSDSEDMIAGGEAVTSGESLEITFGTGDIATLYASSDEDFSIQSVEFFTSATVRDQVTIECDTEGATIYYTTDGSAPTEDSTEYAAAITITENTTVKARAYLEDWIDSEIGTETFYASRVDTPIMSPDAGGIVNGQSITITCDVLDATIYYTTDGTTPTEESTEYTGTFTIPNDAATTVKAKAFHPNYWQDSEVATYEYQSVQDAELSIMVTVGDAEDFTLPLGSSSEYEQWLSVDWGDESSSVISSYIDSDKTHTFETAGSYNIKITGKCEYFGFDGGGSKDAITNVLSLSADMGLRVVNFKSCSNLLSIDATLLTNSYSIETMRYFAYGAGITSIPSGFFDNLADVDQFSYAFYGCPILSIPSELLLYCVAAKYFNSTFKGTPIIEIPSGMFDTCVLAEEFDGCFADCALLETIASGLLANCPNAYWVQSMFDDAVSLTSTPATIFTGSQVRRARYCFAGAALSALRMDIFDGESWPEGGYLDVAYMFEGLSSMTGSGNDFISYIEAKLAEYGGTLLSSEGCFSGCTSLSDYASIPAGWK